MNSNDRCRIDDIPPKFVKHYIETAKQLVKELIEMVAENDPVFSNYKIELSGSTREKARVGNPYEIDFLIMYEIDFEEVIEVENHPGFVRIKPKSEDLINFQKFVTDDGMLQSDKILFSFFTEVFGIVLKNDEYRKRTTRLCLGKVGNCTGRTLLSVNNFREKGIGAAIELDVVLQYDDSSSLGSPDETLDVVLSFHFKNGYWPDCTKEWQRKKLNISQEVLQEITAHGAAVVCKPPDPLKYKNTGDLFRLSFSFAEAKLFEYATEEQREAYKILKTIKKISMNDSDFNFIQELDPTGLLNKKLVSYHLKTTFFDVVYSNYSTEVQSDGKNKSETIRKWLILYLTRLIECLHKRSMKHFFIVDLELFNYEPLDEEIDERLFQIYCNVSKKEESIRSKIEYPDLTLPKLKMVYLMNYLDEGKIDHFKILKEIFTKALNFLPQNLSDLHKKCSYTVELNAVK